MKRRGGGGGEGVKRRDGPTQPSIEGRTHMKRRDGPTQPSIESMCEEGVVQNSKEMRKVQAELDSVLKVSPPPSPPPAPCLHLPPPSLTIQHSPYLATCRLLFASWLAGVAVEPHAHGAA